MGKVLPLCGYCVLILSGKSKEDLLRHVYFIEIWQLLYWQYVEMGKKWGKIRESLFNMCIFINKIPTNSLSRFSTGAPNTVQSGTGHGEREHNMISWMGGRNDLYVCRMHRKISEKLGQDPRMSFWVAHWLEVFFTESPCFSPLKNVQRPCTYVTLSYTPQTDNKETGYKLKSLIK